MQRARHVSRLQSVLAHYNKLEYYCHRCISALQIPQQRLIFNVKRLSQPSLADLWGAMEFNNVSSALEAHVREACGRSWALPDQLPAPARPEEGVTSPSRAGLRVEGMWPYWLDGRSLRTVRNNLDLDSMVILTGLAR